jgi:hypothetical protein
MTANTNRGKRAHSEGYYEPPRHQESPSPRKLTNHRFGLLVNFNSALIKQGIPAIDPLLH